VIAMISTYNDLVVIKGIDQKTMQYYCSLANSLDPFLALRQEV
jgi:hypothetical protein